MLQSLRKKSGITKCLSCEADLGLVRTWMKLRFCSKQHERQHMEQLNELALERLEEHDKRLKAYLLTMQQRELVEADGAGCSDSRVAQ